MFAQNNKRNIIPFSHFGYDRNEAVEITYRRRSSVTTVSEDILQLVWNNTGDGMCITDSDGIIVSVNPSFCSLIHMSETELIGKEFTVMYSPDVEKDKLRAIYFRTLASGSYQKKYEKSFHLHDDTTIEIEITKTELVDDAEEHYLLTEYRDISKQMNWERNVQESELNYRSLFDHAVMPMYQSSAEGSAPSLSARGLRSRQSVPDGTRPPRYSSLAGWGFSHGAGLTSCPICPA